MFKKTTFIITIIFFLSDLNGVTRRLHPAVKSSLFPGWGEISLSKPKQSRFFILLELTLWSSCIGFYQFSNHKKMQYQSYAAEYAGVNPKNKNHKYWVDIGNYINQEQHNAEHLRWRYINDLYENNDSWSWESKYHMKKFEKMRIESDMLSKYGEYVIGVITLNHIVSAINSLYLSKLPQNLELYSSFNGDSFKLHFYYDF